MLHACVVDADVWIRVYLNEPDSEILVNHEVKAKKLERIAPLVGVQRVLGGEIAVNGNVLHPLDEITVQVQIVLRKLSV